jgi:hypothetical protein
MVRVYVMDDSELLRQRLIDMVSEIQGVDSLVEIMNSLPDKQKVVIKALDHPTGNTGYLEVDMP